MGTTMSPADLAKLEDIAALIQCGRTTDALAAPFTVIRANGGIPPAKPAAALTKEELAAKASA